MAKSSLTFFLSCGLLPPTLIFSSVSPFKTSMQRVFTGVPFSALIETNMNEPMIWDMVRSGLKDALGENVFQLWIKPLTYVASDEKQLVVASPDKYVTAYVRKHFQGRIETLLEQAGYGDMRLVFQEQPRVAVQSVAGKKPAAAGRKRVVRQRRLPNVPENNSYLRSMNPKYTFDEFMVGESNALAEAACKAMVEKDPVFGPCLYLNAGSGLGKSHLTHALAQKIYAESPYTRVHYITARQFCQEMLRELKNRNMDEFKTKYQENCDILLVEDVHTLTKKMSHTQEELNDVLDSLLKSGKRVVLTSKASPQELKEVDSELCSRMASGLVTDIKTPDVKTRCSIVAQKARSQKLSLDEESVHFIGNRVRGDVRRIESVLRGVQGRALLSGGRVSLDMVREVVSQIVGFTDSVITASMICELVSSQYGVSVDDLSSRSRKRSISVPRQVAMYLSRKYTEDSLVDIGRIFNRNHATVLHSIKVVGQRLRCDGAMQAQMDMLSDKVQQM